MSLHLPTPASRLAIFTALVSLPVAMRGPELTTLLSDHWRRHEERIDVGARLRGLGRVEAVLVQDGPGGVSLSMPSSSQLWPWEEPIYVIEGGVAYLQITGAMLKGYDDFTAWYWGFASIDRIGRALDEIGARNDVRKLVLLINSPGGSACGTPELGAQLVALGERMLTVAYTSDMACSAAYWVACSCRYVFTTPSAIVGSIGVYLALYDYTEMLKEWGVKLELFRAGNLKGIGVMGKEFTDDERAFLRDSVSRIYAGFTGHVRARRSGVADTTMQGQWFDGEQGVELGLVDRTVTGFPELVAAVQEELPA